MNIHNSSIKLTTHHVLIIITILTTLPIALSFTYNQPLHALQSSPAEPDKVTQFSCSTVDEIATSDCNALVTFYNNLNGVNWSEDAGWLDTNTPCAWFGVNCIGDRISSIQLPNNNLVGSIPPELGNLTALRVLNLSQNHLTGAIPTEITNLPFLGTLKVSENELTGEVSTTLSNLSNLQELWLQNNQLTGELPTTLGNLTNLSDLRVNGNPLAGSLPSELINTHIFQSDQSDTILHYGGLCVPNDAAFLTRLDQINDRFPEAPLCHVAGDNAIGMEKTVSSDTGQANDLLTFTIAISSTGSTNSVILTDTIPAVLTNITVLSGVGSYDSTNHQIDFSGSVAPNNDVIIQYQATIDANAQSGVIFNSAVATGADMRVERAASIVIVDTSATKTLSLIYAVGDNNLGEEMMRQLNNAEQAANNVNNTIIMLVDGPGVADTHIYHVQHDIDQQCPSLDNIDCNGRYRLGENLWEWTDNTANKASLSLFLQSQLQAYPNVDQVLLSITGHGSGWTADALEESPVIQGRSGNQIGRRAWFWTPDPLGGLLQDVNPVSSISTEALGDALQEVHEITGKKIDLLYLEACSMGAFEVAYEVQEYADSLLVSQSLAWSGAPYDQYMTEIDGAKTGQQIGERWLDIHANSLDLDGYPYTLSLIDLSQMDTVAQAVDVLGNALSDELSANGETARTQFKAARDNTTCYESNYDGFINENDSSCDLDDFASELEVLYPGTAIASAAQAVQTAMSNAVVQPVRAADGTPHLYSDEFWTLVPSGGLNIYLPLHVDEWKRNYYSGSNLQSAVDGAWDDFLLAYWGGSLNTRAIRRCTADGANGTTSCAEIGSPTDVIPTLRFNSTVLETEFGQPFTVDINYSGSGASTTGFTVEYHEACLTLNNAVRASGLTGSEPNVSTAGQAQLSNIQRDDSSSFVDMLMGTLEFTPICQPSAFAKADRLSTSSVITTPLTFTAVSFMSGTSSVTGTSFGSIVQIQAATSTTPTIPITPLVKIPDGIRGVANSDVTVPISVTTLGEAAGSAAFDMHFDTNCIVLDSGDSDGDGIPDDIVLNQTTNHELEVNQQNINTGHVRMVVSPLSTDNAHPFELSPLITLHFDIVCQNQASTDITFSDDSFGDLSGQSLDGSALGNTIWLGRAPIAVDDSAGTNEDTPITIDLADNDSDPDHDLVRIQSVYTPNLSALVTLIQTGTIEYNPIGEFDSLSQSQSATEVFSYTILDNLGFTDTARIEVTILGANDAPVAISDTVFITENESISITPLINDTDVDGDTLSLDDNFTTPISGTLTKSGTSLLYQPDNDFNYLGAGTSVTMSIEYTATDGHGGASQTRILFTIHGAADSPITNGYSNTVRTAPGQRTVIDALVDDSDPDTGDTLAILSVTQPVSGTASVQNNQVIYTPTSDFYGIQMLSYIIKDSANLTASGQITVAVGIAGDCNQDGFVDAGDLTACVVEVFDNDADHWLRVPQGSFLGNPVGCDPNEDMLVGAGDLSCKVLKVLNGASASCVDDTVSAASRNQAVATLTLPEVLAVENGQVEVPITLNGNGHQIGAAVLHLDIDESLLTFDESTGLSHDLPLSYDSFTSFDGRHLGITYISLLLDEMPDGVITTLTFSLVNENISMTELTDAVGFSVRQRTSLGSIMGQSVPVTYTPIKLVKVFMPVITR
ncbi:MAG: Ig-like domain-containing protein [Chloroflexota bacterium]